MRMLRLHFMDTLILVNPAQIQTVFPSNEDMAKAFVYLSGEDDPIRVDEDLETIDRLISLN